MVELVVLACTVLEAVVLFADKVVGLLGALTAGFVEVGAGFAVNGFEAVFVFDVASFCVGVVCERMKIYIKLHKLYWSWKKENSITFRVVVFVGLNLVAELTVFVAVVSFFTGKVDLAVDLISPFTNGFFSADLGAGAGVLGLAVVLVADETVLVVELLAGGLAVL